MIAFTTGGLLDRNSKPVRGTGRNGERELRGSLGMRLQEMARES